MENDPLKLGVVDTVKLLNWRAFINTEEGPPCAL